MSNSLSPLAALLAGQTWFLQPPSSPFGDAQPKHVPPCFHISSSFTCACDATGSLAQVPMFSPCSHCSLAEHIPSSSTFVHTQMSPGALLELAPGGSSALWAPRAGLCAPGPLHPVAPRGLSPHPWQSTLRDLLCSVSVQSLMREGKEKEKKNQLIYSTIKLLNSFLSSTLLQVLSDRWGQIEWFNAVR